MKRFFTLILAVLAVPVFSADWKPAPGPLTTRWGKELNPDKVLPEYPRPQLVRNDWLNLNGLWDYAITAKGAAKPEKWDGQILVPFCPESALSGVGKPVGEDKHLWYRRKVERQETWEQKRVLLHFGAVDWETTVFVNGLEIGLHRGGFDPFTFDITDALKETGGNELVVRVWDPTDAGSQPVGKQVRKPEGIWYTAVTGIWQTVWIEPVPEASLSAIHAVPDVDGSTITVSVDVRGAKDDDTLRVNVLRGAQLVATGDGAVRQAIKLDVANPKLWTPDEPNLYDLHVGLIRNGKPIDTATSYFAMRKISAAKDEAGVMRLMLNNKPLFQLGPLDQGWWPDGLYTAPSDAALSYDLKVLKDLGMNMLRKHIKVEPARLYYHCDKLGLLVWQDMPSVINRNKKHFITPDAKADAEFDAAEKATYLKELKVMIDHLRFFPCIVVWVPFNEGWGQHDTNDVLKWVKKYDPTRLVDGPSGWTDRGVGDMKDLHQYPGPGMFPVMPDRVSVLGEFGGLGLPLKGHLWQDSKNWGYRTFKTQEELREAYRRLTLGLRPLIGKGLSAAVYTQTTDVEVEVNGFMTYDREIIKFDVKETAQWHKRLFGPSPVEHMLVETSEKAGQPWRYTLDKQADGWEGPSFEDTKWTEGEGGFGTKGTPGAIVRTEWKTADIWARRTFELKESPTGSEVYLRIHHDEDAEVYVNGIRAGQVAGFVGDYVLIPMNEAARKALKVGKNTLAVHCHQTGGGQYIDVGIVELVEKK